MPRGLRRERPETGSGRGGWRLVLPTPCVDTDHQLGVPTEMRGEHVQGTLPAPCFPRVCRLGTCPPYTVAIKDQLHIAKWHHMNCADLSL